MDPLTISVSVLTILDAGGKLSKLLRKSVHLRNAPDVLLALNNEVVDMHLVVTDVNDLLLSHHTGENPPRSLVNGLERARSLLLRLESFISYELTTMTSKGDVRVDKSVLFRSERRLQDLQHEIRDIRIALGSGLSLFASSIAIHGQVQTQRTLGSIEITHGKLARNQSNGLHTPNGEIKNGLESSEGLETEDQPLTKSTLADLRLTNSPTTINFYQNVCDADCSCACHSSYSRIKSPSLFSSLFGSLFIGYRASPLATQVCSLPNCRAKATKTTFAYTFPPWLMKRTVAMMYSSTLSRGPEFLLRVLRVREANAIHKVMQRFDQTIIVEKVKRMLNDGQASVLDVDEHGCTYLHRAILEGHWDVAQLLISYGSDLHHEDEFARSVFIEVWTKRLQSHYLPKDVLDRWDQYFLPDYSQFDVFGFSELHKAYLELSGLRFEDVLASTHRSNLDRRDCQGRTVLNWAVARRDLHSVTRLLLCGANPNLQDKRGFGPFHLAVYLHDVPITKLLLDAKADVTLLDVDGATILHHVAFDDVSLVKEIIKAGADIEGRDKNGNTPLLRACAEKRLLAAQNLLECGADINAQGRNGHNVLAFAIEWKSHEVLSFLLSQPSLNTDTEDTSGWDAFIWAAAFSDMQIVHILKNEWPGTVNLQRRSFWGNALESAQARRDNNALWAVEFSCLPDEDPTKWYEEFEDMINTILERSRSAEPTNENEMEKGVDPCSDDEDQEWMDASEQIDQLTLSKDREVIGDKKLCLDTTQLPT